MQAAAEADKRRYDEEHRAYKAAKRRRDRSKSGGSGKFGLPMPKRPPNSYALYYKRVYESAKELAGKDPEGGSGVTSVAKVVGGMWQALSAEEKQKYKVRDPLRDARATPPHPCACCRVLHAPTAPTPVVNGRGGHGPSGNVAVDPTRAGCAGASSLHGVPSAWLGVDESPCPKITAPPLFKRVLYSCC